MRRTQPMQRVYGTAFFSQKELDEHLDAHRGSEEARSPQARSSELGALSPSTRVAPGAGVLDGARARRSTTRSPTTCAARQPAGYQEVKTPIVYNKALWEHVRALVALPREHVPGPEVETDEHEMGLKPMNCPAHHLLLRHREAQLPRDADPLSRADAAAPERGVGRAGGTDARPPVLAGRLPLSSDGGSDSPTRSRLLMGFIHGHYAAFGLEATREVRDASREAHRRDAMWDHAESGAQEALESDRQALHDQRRRRRVLRAED